MDVFCSDMRIVLYINSVGRDLNPWNDSLFNKRVTNLFIGEHCYKIVKEE
jgi:hypothetical protein